jgi:hypothetical protein
MPRKQLKGFRRITLDPGETETVAFVLTPEELYVFNEGTDAYEVEPGDFTVRVGGSSDNLPMEGHFTLTGSEKKSDLQVASVRMIPPVPVQRSPVVFLATVINRGTGPSPADATHRVSFRVNGKEVAWCANFRHAIPAGGMALAAADGGPSGSEDWRAGAPGDIQIEAVVDPSNLIQETLEDNNGLAVRAAIRPYPPENLALGSRVQASSVEAQGLEAANAVDGNPATRWSSAFTDPQSFTVDLGAPFDVDRVVLYWESAFGTEYGLLTSLDGISWNESAHRTGGNGGLDTLSVSVSARYLRLSCLRRGTGWGYSLYEFEVYSGTPPPDPEGSGTPGDFFMESGYPNPFNRRTAIPYGVTRAARVRIVLYDVSGRCIRTLVDAALDPGRYEAEWDGSDGDGNDVPSGAYLVRMEAGTFTKTRKLMMLR